MPTNLIIFVLFAFAATGKLVAKCVYEEYRSQMDEESEEK